MVEEALNDVLRKTLHNEHGGAQSVVVNVVEQLRLDLPCRNVIRGKLKAHIWK